MAEKHKKEKQKGKGLVEDDVLQDLFDRNEANRED